jgi:hypothetical protein
MSLVYISSTHDTLIRKIIHPFYTVINRHFSYMALPLHKRYEIVFLSNHPLGPQLNHTDVAKAVHCSTSTVKYWLNRWIESKDLSDSARLGRPRATTQEQDQRIVSLAEQKTFVTAQDIAN